MPFSGSRLREYRVAMGMSLDEFGKKLNITKQQLSCYEVGVVQPGAEKLEAIAQALGIKIDDLFESKNKKRNAA